MKITFVGLSSFLLESENGGKVLLDPYKDSPEYSFGLKFPNNLQADLFFVSHPDDDHSNLSSTMLRKFQPPNQKSKNTDLFPDINIKGVVVSEYNGDPNVAYAITLDKMRFLHLADNAHKLLSQQVREIGEVNIVFMSPPKVRDQNYHIENITLLKPNIVFVSHIIPPITSKERPDKAEVSHSLSRLVMQEWITNPHANQNTANTFTDMFLSGLGLKDSFDFEQIFDHSLTIQKTDLPTKTKVILFRKCLGQEY